LLVEKKNRERDFTGGSDTFPESIIIHEIPSGSNVKLAIALLKTFMHFSSHALRVWE